jgi:hypothetical protein
MRSCTARTSCARSSPSAERAVRLRSARPRVNVGVLEPLMHAPTKILLVLCPLLLAAGCDSGGSTAKVDPAVEDKAKEEAETKARMEKRKQEREAKEAAAVKEKEDILAGIERVTVIPEGAKMPKKVAEACEQVVNAQRGFMKKFHPQVTDDALTTQLGLLKKQCVEMNDIKVSICQKFALEATDELLQKSINEYLPACLKKYGKGGEAPKVPSK